MLPHAGMFAQELFPVAEPASTYPQKVPGIRLTKHYYLDQVSRSRAAYTLRYIYGVNKNLSIISSLTCSNHHLKKIPLNFQSYIINHHQRGYRDNPFIIEGINLYAKCRVVSLDKKSKHFRIAVYSEFAQSFSAHDRAEPNLLSDNTGYGYGIILTKLINRFAASLTWGYIKPFEYIQNNPDNVYVKQIRFKSGDALLYNASFGYRLYPLRYKSYKDLNINLYFECIGKQYESAQIYYDGKPYDQTILKEYDRYGYMSLQRGAYVDAKPSVQFIFKSTTRLDVGMAWPLYKRSFNHTYPLLYLSFQKLFFKTKPVN
ncbi:MAG: hypothetical protein NZ529_06330 [Cytophagaceae bacterium]|nr:hypothetical protein [Cytophagaceae bacterium]MDW8456396.1 hypothetical protein [Cytophagaceae bacterium]